MNELGIVACLIVLFVLVVFGFHEVDARAELCRLNGRSVTWYGRCE